ncbi:MAG: hypothetical protein AABZ33_10045 [Chloroflexota bacterium]
MKTTTRGAAVPPETRRGGLERVGLALTVGGGAGLAAVFLLQGQLGGFAPLIGGLALNAAIVGPVLIARRAAARLGRRLPRWLGW